MKTPTVELLHIINLRGGAGDLACGGCLPAAKRERAEHDEIVSVAIVDAPGEACGWCGVRQGEELNP